MKKKSASRRLESKLLCRSLPVAALLLPLLSACGSGGDDSDSSPPKEEVSFGTEKACTDLVSNFHSDGVRIVSAVANPASEASGRTPALPQHCEVVGSADERVGVDDQNYAIKFHLRIPMGDAWSGRFVFSGGGGSNGSIGDALAVNGSPVTPLVKGDAVLTQDSGHDNDTNDIPEKGGNRSFGFDFKARQDNFYRSHGRVAKIAKEVIDTFQGNPPEYSYFAGCSKGGQEAAMVSQRFPDMFDGIVVGDPLLAAPMASMVRPASIAQTFAALATEQGQIDRNGLPFLNKTFTDADLDVLKAGVIDQCDALDGVVDGLSQDFKACAQKFDITRLQCKPGQVSGCLSEPQVATLDKQMKGMSGDFGWYYDIGIVEGQLRSWWLGRYDAEQTNNSWVGRAVSTMYLTPPQAVHSTANNGSEPYRWLLNFDIPSGTAGIYATTPDFPESAWDMTFATGTDLSKFKQHGGKMLVYHGIADGAFTIQQTIDWIEGINKENGGDATDFVRMYPVPGMGHCRGGQATSSFDMLTAVQDWVEQGKAPETVLATAPAGTPWEGRTRPLCTYPKVARYKGGDVESADSFVCE